MKERTTEALKQYLKKALYLGGTSSQRTGTQPPSCLLLENRLYMSPIYHRKLYTAYTWQSIHEYNYLGMGCLQCKKNWGFVSSVLRDLLKGRDTTV